MWSIPSGAGSRSLAPGALVTALSVMVRALLVYFTALHALAWAEHTWMLVHCSGLS